MEGFELQSFEVPELRRTRTWCFPSQSDLSCGLQSQVAVHRQNGKPSGKWSSGEWRAGKAVSETVDSKKCTADKSDVIKRQDNFRTQFGEKLASDDKTTLLQELMELIITEKEKMEQTQEHAKPAGQLEKRWKKYAREAEESKCMAQMLLDVCDGVCSQ